MEREQHIDDKRVVTQKEINELAKKAENLLQKKAREELPALKDRSYRIEKAFPFWKIFTKKRPKNTVLTLKYDISKRTLEFWCIHKNCPKNTYNELKEMLRKYTEKLGLKFEDLNPRK